MLLEQFDKKLKENMGKFSKEDFEKARKEYIEKHTHLEPIEEIQRVLKIIIK